MGKPDEQPGYKHAVPSMPEPFVESTAAVMRELREENARLKADIAEWETSFNLYTSAVARGDKLWQDNHPYGHPHVLPDTGKLVEWLLELVAKAEEAVKHGPGKGNPGAGAAGSAAARDARRPEGTEPGAG